MKHIPFAKVDCSGNELPYVAEVLRSGWLTTASKCAEFERRFAECVGARYACAVSSATAALHLATEALGIGPGDKVLVPSMTFTASAEIIRYVGADPILLDVEYGTSLLTPKILSEALERHPDAKAVIVVHFGGQAADMPRILNIAHAAGLRVIEDAAHAFPCRCQDRMIGTFGDATCFSFYANKTITTGEGGMLVTDNESIYKRAKIMRLHGIDSDVWDRFTGKHPKWEYDVTAPGFKYNLPDISAAIGLAQLERCDEFRSQRQRCAEFYYEHLSGIPFLDLPTCHVPFEDHSWHLFPVILTEESPVERNRCIEELNAAGIGTSVHYKPLHRMTYYRDLYSLCNADYPNAERIWRGTMSLPIYTTLLDSELAHVANSLRKILGCKSRPPLRCATTDPRHAATPHNHRRIYLSPPHMNGLEQELVKQAFHSNFIAPGGPMVAAFEREFLKHVSFDHAVAVSSGTAAIHLALRHLVTKRTQTTGAAPTADFVLASTLTYIGSVTPATFELLGVTFVDCDRESWNMDPNLLEQELERCAATDRLPLAVLPTDIYGQCCNLPRIREICDRYGVPVICDSAEAVGAWYHKYPAPETGNHAPQRATDDSKTAGVPAGGDAWAAAYSFNGNKIITTSGGGMLASNDVEMIAHARKLSTQARDPAPHYQHSEIGFNYRMSNVVAAIGVGQLHDLSERVARRRAIFDHYRRELGQLPGISFMPEANYNFSTRWLTVMLVDSTQFGATPSLIRKALEAEDIEARPVWKPMHLQPVFAGCRIIGGAIAEELFQKGLCLPSGTAMNQDDLDRVCRIVQSCQGRG